MVCSHGDNVLKFGAREVPTSPGCFEGARIRPQDIRGPNSRHVSKSSVHHLMWIVCMTASDGAVKEAKTGSKEERWIHLLQSTASV